MHFKQLAFWLTTTLILSPAYASPAPGVLATRQARPRGPPALPLISFAAEFVQYVQPGEIVKDCNPRVQQVDCTTPRSLERRQEASVCPRGSQYRNSVCHAFDVVLSLCFVSSLASLHKVYTLCPRGSVCVQRGASFLQRRARCVSILDLVLWYTPPDPAVEATQTVGAADAGTVSCLTNNFYDAAGNTSLVFDTIFTGQPGNIYLGDVRYSDAPESYAISWGKTKFVDIAVKAGIVGGLQVASFLSALDP